MAETPFLRVFDARYGYLLKCNMPVSEGPQDVAVAPQPAPRRGAPSALQSKEAVEAEPAVRTGDRSRPRSPRAPRRKRGGQKHRRSRRPRLRPQAPPADQMADKSAYEERMGFWLAVEESRGSLRDKCKNCYIGLGTHAPKHEGRSCHDLGNQCYLPRRARGCGRKRARHWACDCPNRVQLNERSRRPA